jgi:hypothetical protein
VDFDDLLAVEEILDKEDWDNDDEQPAGQGPQTTASINSPKQQQKQ